MSSSNRKGWRVLRGSNSQLPRGTRVMRDPSDESRSFQIWEGVEGWKKGLTLIRSWRDEAGMRCFSMNLLNWEDMPLAHAKGVDDQAAWKNIFAQAKLAGIMPKDATE